MVLGISAIWEEWRAAKRARARSHSIDRQIEEDFKTLKRTCSVLLMGSVLCYILSPRLKFYPIRNQSPRYLHDGQAIEDVSTWLLT